jgi:hypothetical protein
MPETTEILFNSPALHSLRRDQLQKICKHHSLKANGKNTELIERLKYHALTLPKDDPLSIAARSEESNIVAKLLSRSSDTSHNESDYQMNRPSDQWEIVMESIQEVEESTSQGTLSSQRTIETPHSSGEFGAVHSKSAIYTANFALSSESSTFFSCSNNSKLVHQSFRDVSQPQENWQIRKLIHFV